MIKLRDLLNENEDMLSKLQTIVKNTLGNKPRVSRFDRDTYLVYPGGIVRPSHVQYMADELEKVIPQEWLADPVGDLKPIRVGRSGVTENQIIIVVRM